MTASRLRVGSRLLIAAACAVIAIATLTPLGEGDRGCALGIPCTTGHAGAFAALGAGIAGAFATSERARRSPRRVLVMALLAVWVFAALDELLQGAVGRDPALGDWLADMAGALAGMLAGSVALRALVRGRAR